LGVAAGIGVYANRHITVEEVKQHMADGAPDMQYHPDFSRAGIWNGFGRLGRVCRKLKQELRLGPDDVVLDVGCNRGDLVACLRPGCRRVVGIDVNERAVRSSDVDDLHVMSILDTDFPDDCFTRIVSSHTIEHIDDLGGAFAEMSRILRPGGLVVLHYPWEVFRGMATMRNAYRLFRDPFRGYELHRHRLCHGKIRSLIRGTRLHIVDRKFFWDPQPGYITVLTKSVRDR